MNNCCQVLSRELRQSILSLLLLSWWDFRSMFLGGGSGIRRERGERAGLIIPTSVVVVVIFLVFFVLPFVIFFFLVLIPVFVFLFVRTLFLVLLPIFVLIIAIGLITFAVVGGRRGNRR
jgi:hypothetical protein